MKISIKTAAEIEKMRRAGKILQKVQKILKKNICAGISILELDAIAEKKILENGATPGFKNFHGFPGTICAMINSEVVHAIPTKKILRDGDLLSVDCGVKFDGYFADAAFSIVVGGDEKNPARAKFSRTVFEALQCGCEKAIAGNFVGDIGHAIEKKIHAAGFAICREYTGHGLGKNLHENPTVFNFGRPGTGPQLKSGMTLAIEPIISAGSSRTRTAADNWTVTTADGADACQWEFCGVVREKKFEIFA